MAFLDQSGDIIVDCVLTDLGRKRLASGDGSFRITKFALGDDEIDYSLYNKNHSSGSAYFDLEILQTPIFEALTNNISSMKSKLISINRNNLLYLPVVRINNTQAGGAAYASSAAISNGYIVAVDDDTEARVVTGPLASTTGVLYGENTQNSITLRLDQGLDSSDISPAIGLSPDLVETQYIVEIDNRFGYIVPKNNSAAAPPSFVDDDDIASYYFSLGTDRAYVKENPNANIATATINNGEILAGPRGTTLEFKVKSSIELNTGTYLFGVVGSVNATDSTISQIFSTIRVTGVTTGYSMDIPVVFMKKTS